MIQRGPQKDAFGTALGCTGWREKRAEARDMGCWRTISRMFVAAAQRVLPTMDMQKGGRK